MLGLAMKAGKLRCGGFLTEESIRSGQAQLVILAQDAKKNTYKTISDKCGYYAVPLQVYGTKEQLGRALGRGEIACAALTDEGFAGSIRKMLRSDQNDTDDSERNN